MGKDTFLNTDDVGVTHAVLKLLEGLENQGHHIYITPVLPCSETFAVLALALAALSGQIGKESPKQ